MRQAWSLLLLLGCVLSGKEAHPILRKFDTDRNQGELEGLNSLDTANLDGVPCIRLRKLAHALSCVTGASVGGSGRIVRISEDMKDVVLYNSSDLVNLTVATSCSTFNETQFLTLYSEVTRFSPDIITIVLTECAQIENSSGGNMDVMQVSLYVDVSQTISFDDPPKPQPQTQKAFEEGAFQAAGLDVIAVGPFSSPSSTPQPHPQNEPASAVAENGSSGPSVLMATLAGGAAFLFVLLAAAASWKMIQASNRRCFVCIEGTITASRRTAKRPCSQCKDSLKSGTRTLYLCSECLSRGAPGKRAIMCARRKATLEAKELDRVDVRNVCGGGVEAFYCFKGHHFAHIREKAPAVQRSGVFCVSCLQLHTARSQRREARSSTSPSSSDGQVISTPPTEQITPATVPGSEAPPQVSDLERPTLSQEECRSWDSGHVVGPQETVLEELPTQSGATHWPLDDLHSGMELDPTFGLEPDGPNLQPALGFDDQFELDVFDSSLPPAAIELQF